MCSKLLFDEVQSEFQDELINVISSMLQSPRIRFWQSSERTLTENELLEQFEIFNIFVYVTNHSKKSKKTEFKIKVGRNFGLELLGSGLDYTIESNFRSWARSAASILVSYFKEHYYGLYIGVLRFDLLTKNRKDFIIPNFRLESNIYLYNNLLDANASQLLYDKCLRGYKNFEDSKAIPFEKLVQDRIDDKNQLEQFSSMLKTKSSQN